MSLDYVGNIKGVCINLNIAGCDLVAELHTLAGLPTVGSRGHRVPYEASAELAYAWGSVLQYFDIPEQTKLDAVASGLIEELGDLEALKNDWVTFLMTCDGYEAI